MNRTDWVSRVEAASAEVEEWLAVSPDAAWRDVVEGTWSARDVVGHLAAWSDLLLGEAEALVQDGAGVVEVVDIDAWNAEQVTARRDWSVAQVQAAWRASVERALHVVARLSAEDLARCCPVRWSDEPVSPADLLDLWVNHVQDHREPLAVWRKRYDTGDTKTKARASTTN
ncbi:MAG: DinB family protein [Chloroflexi bacterium]|nr:DinB family protein [Chloroflexota bacterium]MBU1750588.1 DinB family protein [Chloroflexota bacterium]